VELKRQRVTLASVVDAALEACRPAAERAGHRLAVELPEQPVWIDGDPTRLAQVFSNVLNNAIKYTPHGGRIALRAVADGDTVEIDVKDNGIGIPPDMAARVFDLFVQGPDAASAGQGGLGIGLSLVRKLVELHGGLVTLASAGAGEGTTVRITLPVVAAEAAQPDGVTAIAVAATPKRRVLVVDDNVDAADSLGLLLAGSGHVIQVVHTGQAAIAAAQAFRPDLVFLDIGLPDLSGYDVAAALRKTDGNGMRIVALTGWGNDEARERSAASGFDLHLTKPVQIDMLQRLLAGAGDG
jgi:CheY-like chemotaxis protein